MSNSPPLFSQLSPETQARLARLEIERRARQRVDPPSFADFARSTCHFSLDPWQEVLCSRLQRLAYEKGQRLLVHAPPQWGKSFLLSQRFPAYYLGRKPKDRVKLASYNITHATRFGSVCRDLTQESAYKKAFPQSEVPPRQPRDTWSTSARINLADGQVSFASLGLQTGFVGAGCELLLIDDPYSSPQDAASEAINESVWTFWDEAARVRLTADANVVVMFHRYRDNDFAGRLIEAEGLKRNGGRWELMRFACVADGHGDDPMGREVGEKLSPRMTDEYIAEQMKSGFAWEGQFQGLPGRKGGNMFNVEKLRIVDAAPVAGIACRGWDEAASHASGNFTAGTKILKSSDGIWYIEDVVRGQWDTATRDDIIVQTAELDGRLCLIAGEQEGGSGGKFQAQSFLRMLAGFSVTVVPASGSKEVRADPFSAQVNAGNVRLVRAPWNRAFIEELRAFPLGRYDDQVDSAANAFNRLSSRVRVGAGR